MAGGIVVDARGRDLITGRSGQIGQRDQRLRAVLGPDRSLQSAEADPPEPRLSQLLGAVVGPGFRSRMTQALVDLAERRTLLHALLDDLPGAILVSGYAIQRSMPAAAPAAPPAGGAFSEHVRAAEDMCAGWASDATIMVTFRSTGSVPTPMGPPAPRLEPPGDPMSWHRMEPLPTRATRRRRRLDLVPPSPRQPVWTFDSHFRDSYRDAEGVETAVHEYLVDGWLDDACQHVGEARAEARVLPWMECPAAVGSADRMAGRALADLRSAVRAEFVGTTTCTHLNDTFRSLADLLPLRAMIAGGDHELR